MKKMILILIVCVSALPHTIRAQFAYGDRWYNNPLGFYPLNLHASMGFILPAAATGVCLLLTKNKDALKQRFSIYTELNPSWGYKYPNTFLPQINAGFNYKLRKFMSGGVEFGALFPNDVYNCTVGFNVKPFARFFPVNKDTWRLYFESGGGLVYTFSEFPKPTCRDDRTGLQLNGITKYGIGAEVDISEYISVLGGIRHVHISNGNVKGIERNPSHDSNGFFIGLTHKLKG